jgi:beta-lactamase regulating signal transducer with metallopeptidase domain
MHVLIGIAVKSLLIAGMTLIVLQLMKRRSAAERSWVAHIGLLALVIMAFSPLVLPAWNVEAPAMFNNTGTGTTVASAPAPSVVEKAALPTRRLANPIPVNAAPTVSSFSPAAAATAIYALPAAILLFITLLALMRLFALRARADVLVDGHWLSALARAQRRMGFKHGTALLTSNELASPISWGLMRPVILLNSRAVEASAEAEAIIAHELAHVARMDWMNLLLARVASALFWFNPVVWLLAREAHQLREEAADDSVLAANIVDTDYAQLLVGVARHDCPGLLLGAHGVAPSKSSLARRVARVLDGKSVRGPVARSFALGVFAGAVVVAAPLAALTFTPVAPKAPRAARSAHSASEPLSPYYPETANEPTDLPSIIAKGVSTSVAGAVAAIHPSALVGSNGSDFETVAANGASVTSSGGVMVAHAPSGATVTVYPADAHGRRKVEARAPNGATSVTYADSDDDIRDAVSAPFHQTGNALQNAIAMKAVGMTPEYVAAMRASAPELRDADADDLVGMKAVGVTPTYVHDLSAAGLRNFDAGDIAGARAVGVDGGYIREMRAAGFGDADLGDLIGARAVGVTSDYVRQMRLAGYDGDLSDFIALRGLKDGRRPRPPLPPLPPARR